jgi:hypothetical protein
MAHPFFSFVLYFIYYRMTVLLPLSLSLSLLAFSYKYSQLSFVYPPCFITYSHQHYHTVHTLIRLLIPVFFFSLFFFLFSRVNISCHPSLLPPSILPQ